MSTRSPGATFRFIAFIAVLTLVVLIAAAFRFWGLKDLPAGLFCDEAALGYNAWAILHYGVDENGASYPLFIWSFGGYKNPVFTYAAMLPIGLLGLDEFSVRATAALFGLGTVIGLFFLGAALKDRTFGVICAFLLAICPWHIHFSRIAFELISFPFLFVLSVLFLKRFDGGRRTLWLSLFFAGTCFYAYAIAKLFVPAFLIGFGVLYLPTLIRRWREWLVASAVFLLTVGPVVWFDIEHHEQGARYFKNTFSLAKYQSFTEKARAFGLNYKEFFSPKFLFEQGDVIPRHAVNHHGELYPMFAPLLLLGALRLLLSRGKFEKLILWWLALYPAGASMMNEIPSASRGFMGSVVLTLVAAYGLQLLREGLQRVLRTPVLRAVGLSAGGAAFLLFSFGSLLRYWNIYLYEYPAYAADAFQFGYRDVIHTMEPLRTRFPRPMMTATQVLEPQIFALFYGQKDPREFARTRDPAYLILVPEEYPRYSVETPVLYALRPYELHYFNSVRIERQVADPGGRVHFVVAEVQGRKRFLTEWATLGPFDNSGGSGIYTDFIPPGRVLKRGYQGKYGTAYWRSYSSRFVTLDLNGLYGSYDLVSPGNAENVCAYAYATIESSVDREARLEISGSGEPTFIWLNGQALTTFPQRFQLGTSKRPIALQQGRNQLLVKSCEDVGYWFLKVRIGEVNGNDIPDLKFSAALPEENEPIAAAAAPNSVEGQILEGFDKIVFAPHYDAVYDGYRRRGLSWFSYAGDEQNEVSWLTKAPDQKKRTYLAFTASMGEQEGTAELWVNREYAVPFEIGDNFESRIWSRGPYRLLFQRRQIIAGNSGFFVLDVPGESVSPGVPIELRVTLGKDSAAAAWFMIKGHDDTARFESLSAAMAAELFSPVWH